MLGRKGSLREGRAVQGASDARSSARGAGRPRLALCIVALLAGVPGFVCVGVGFPDQQAVAFGATSLIIASVIGILALVWNARRRNVIWSVAFLAGFLGLACVAAYAIVNYSAIYAISIRNSTSPSSYRQALATIIAPALVGLCFFLFGLAGLLQARKNRRVRTGSCDKRDK